MSADKEGDAPPDLEADDEPEEPVTRTAAPSFCITGRKTARALIDYTAKSERELSFKKGDVVFIIGTGTETDAGFYAGAMKGAFGIFPINAVELVNEVEVAKPATSQLRLSSAPSSPVLPTQGSRLSVTSVAPAEPPPVGERNDKMRAAVLTELISTERDYVRDLDSLISVFLIPLRATQILTTEQINQIFSSLELIVEVNREVLKELENRMKGAEPEADIQIADIFAKMSNYFKMYVSYCSNQQTCVTTLEACQQQKQVKAFLDVCHSDPKCKGLQILSFLIKPIQRICKYPLLFKELLKYTPGDHPDYQQLILAKQRLDDVAGYVNEGKRFSEALQKVMDIQRNVDGCEISLIAPSRTFVREGSLKVAVGREKPQPRQVYLFNDMILIARARTSSSKDKKKSTTLYYCRAQFLLQKAKLVNVSDTKTLQHAFELHCSGKVAILVCSDEQEKNGWLKDIKIIMKEFQKKQLMEMKKQGASSPRVSPMVRAGSSIY